MMHRKTKEQDIEPAQPKEGSDIEPQAPAGNSPAKAAPTARSQGKGYALVAVVYLLGLCMGALDMGIVNPARTVIQNTLSVDDSLGVWIITIYTLAYAVSIPIMGKLADRHGRKGVYLLCILLFGLGSALCGVALMLEGQSIGRSVFLLFQGAEETGAGAALCCELFDREKVDEIYGAHNLPGFPFGAVLTRAGTFACASRGVTIPFVGKPAPAA